MNDHQKAFLLSITLCCFEEIKANEPGDTKKSVARRKKLRRLAGDLITITDMYLPPDGFAFEDMQKAHQVVDLVNEKIKEMYPE